MNDITVKTFDEERVSKLIKEADPYLKKYIACLKKHLELQNQLTQEAISKLRNSKNELENIKAVIVREENKTTFPILTETNTG